MLTNRVSINSSDIPSLLKKYFLVRYIVDPNSWNDLLEYITPESKELDIKRMIYGYCQDGKFSAFFPEEIKHISEEGIENLLGYYTNTKDFIIGGYIQVFIENYTDNPYREAFLRKIGKRNCFFYNNYPYGSKLIITADEEHKKHFSIPGNFCRDISGFYHYKEDAIDWDFSNQIETKRLHIKDESGKEFRLKIDTPYRAYRVYAKKEYSKFLIGYNSLNQKESDDVIKIGKINKNEDICSIKEYLLDDVCLKVNPSFILKFGTDVIEYEAAKYEQSFQLKRVLEKINRKYGTSYTLDDFEDFLNSLSVNQEIKYKEEIDGIKIEKNELINRLVVVNEKDYGIQVDHNKAIDRVLKTFPDDPEPHELDENKLSQIAKGIFDSEHRLKQELYYEDKDLPFSQEECVYIEAKFKKLLDTQLSSEEIRTLEYRVGVRTSDFSVIAMYNTLHYYRNDSGKSKFYLSLFSSEIWLGICTAYEKHKSVKDKNIQKFKNHELDAESEGELSDVGFDEVDNQEIYEQRIVIQNFIDLIDPTHSDLWNLLYEKLVFAFKSESFDDTFDLRQVYAENLKMEYWNQKHSWESLFNAYKKRCETPLYTMPHFKAIMDYVYSKLVGIEKKCADKPELIQRFQLSIKYKKQIEKELLENFNGEKEKDFLTLISNELSFLCKVVGYHDSRIHIDYEVLVNFIRNFAEIGYETYWFMFNDKEKISVPLKVFYEDRMLSIYENCSNSLGGENNDR